MRMLYGKAGTRKYINISIEKDKHTNIERRQKRKHIDTLLATPLPKRFP